MAVPFRGTLVQCLDRLRQSPIENVGHFIDFTKAAKGTAWRWLMLDEPPSGEFWVRAVAFFRFNDWEVIELTSLTEEVQGLADLWGMGLMSPEELKSALEYNTSSNQGLLRLVYGHTSFLPPQRKLMNLLLADKKEAIAQRRQDLRQEHPIKLEGDLVGDPNHGDAVASLAQLLREAAPLAKALNDDESSGSDQRRDRLRETVGRATYAELAVNLSQMKSAQTRREARQGRVV